MYIASGICNHNCEERRAIEAIYGEYLTDVCVTMQWLIMTYCLMMRGADTMR
jgi:hypothetical protein